MKPGTLAIAKEQSSNAKLGDCATTYAAQQSCPSACVFANGGGCYAETGRVGKFVTAPLNASAELAPSPPTPQAVAIQEAEAIDALSADSGRPLRLHTVGDCSTDEAARIVAAAAARFEERGGGRVWTYTHAWRDVERQSWGTVSVLASCETAADVVLAASRGYATALVVEEFESDKRHRTLSEVSALPCPAQTRDRSCSTCRLCFNDTRLRDAGISIAFELHGIPYAVRQARLALRRPSDPRRRDTVEVQLRELLDERPELTAREASVELVMSEPYAGQLLAFLRGTAKHPSVLRRERYDRAKAAA